MALKLQQRTRAGARVAACGGIAYDAGMLSFAVRRAVAVAGTALAVAGCGSSPPPPTEAPAPEAPPVVAADAAAPDADVPDDVVNAPAWIFRFNAGGRRESWTLRHHGGLALLVVESTQSTTRYSGTVSDGTELAVSVAAGPNHLTLTCKREQRPIGTRCNDAKAKKLDVLDCYHPEFKAPMTFGPSPGIEYVDEPGCQGYRIVPASK